jgi:hypothetical protein
MLDAAPGQLLLHLCPLGLQALTRRSSGALLAQAFHQRPELVAQLVLERLHQPLGQVVAVALHQVGHLDAVTLVQPVLFLVGQGAAQEVTRAVKAQDRQAALLGAAAGRGQVVEQQLLRSTV